MSSQISRHRVSASPWPSLQPVRAWTAPRGCSSWTSPPPGATPKSRAAMWDEISRLAREEGLTVVLTTHYLEEADRLADRLAIVDRGRVVATGTPDQLKSELHGDAVHIEVGTVLAEAAAAAARAALAAVPGVREVSVDGQRLSARADHGAAAVPQVLAALTTVGVPVRAVTAARPSLDDVYLRYAGRRFAEADAGRSGEEVER